MGSEEGRAHLSSSSGRVLRISGSLTRVSYLSQGTKRGGLFLDGEVRLAKNLPDLNHVAFVGGAPLRPFHELFF